MAQAGQAFWGVMVGIKKIKQTAVQTTGLLWGLIGACLLIVLGSFWLYHSEQKTLGAKLDYLWIFPVFGLLLLCVALYLVQRSMRQGLRLALKDLTDHLPVVVYRYLFVARSLPWAGAWGCGSWQKGWRPRSIGSCCARMAVRKPKAIGLPSLCRCRSWSSGWHSTRFKRAGRASLNKKTAHGGGYRRWAMLAPLRLGAYSVGKKPGTDK